MYTYIMIDFYLWKTMDLAGIEWNLALSLCVGVFSRHMVTNETKIEHNEHPASVSQIYPVNYHDKRINIH